MALELSGFEPNYIYAALTILVGIIIAFFVRTFVKWLEAKAETTETKWDDIIIAALGFPVQITIVVISVYVAITTFNIVPENAQFLLNPAYVTSFYILISAWIISSLLHDIITTYGRFLAGKSDTDLDDRLIDLLELVVKYVIWFAAIMAVLNVFEIDITPFLAGAGIVGIAVALAAQDFISNFFGGAIIKVDKPFKVGDRVKINDNYGNVISVGTRSTRIQTLDYQIVTIPNSTITSNVIINYSEPDEKLRFTIPVSVAYGTDPRRVKQILLEVARESIKKTNYLLDDPAPTVFFTEFAESSLNFILRVWARKYNTPDEIKDDINIRIAERFEAEGIEIPFPQMDVHMKK
ncbi:MAG: mechanosensitive ion channel [Methanoregula sp.]|jgi:small-conductance mechanosensitive channel|uniref:mechanosensitive ion channel family protein n=1 Tax=Methanoregula sp. TaxID=2052170 RepID=UPI0025EF4588|nr:mechanosensitive ion channel domain-containing protein [Methanoregula sp.]MCK9632082.1 mechanosensitive ion channel [Methanoregula sp.]